MKHGSWPGHVLAAGAVLLLVLQLGSPAPLQSAQPAISTSVPSVTGLSGQHRVWYAQGRWWALLPDGRGASKLWVRSSEGAWSAQNNLDSTLKHLPANADVWFKKFLVAAVLNGGKRLAVVALAPDTAGGGFVPIVKPLEWNDDGEVEQAYINMDAANNFFVLWSSSSAGSKSIKIRSVTNSFSKLGKTVTLSSGVATGDGCALARLKNGLIALWSDSNRKEFQFVRHPAQQVDTLWMKSDAVLAGTKIGSQVISVLGTGFLDDGVRMVMACDLNGADQGKGGMKIISMKRQLEWFNYPFPASGQNPQTPVLLLRDDKIAAVYLAGNADGKKSVRYVVLEPSEMTAAGKDGILLGPANGLSGLTGAKYPPDDLGALFLVSDSKGNVYEAILNK